MTEFGLVHRVRSLGLTKSERSQFFRACALFVLRFETSTHLRLNLPDRVKSDAKDLIQWMTKTYYPLITLKQGLWLACKGKRLSVVAWELKVRRADIAALYRNCPAKQKRLFAHKRYWEKTPRRIEEELVRLAGSAIRREVYRHLAFITDSDGGVGPDDMAQELSGELAKVVRLYDFPPSVKVDEIVRGIKSWQREISFKLTAQPVREVKSVIVGGVKITDWSIVRDKITIPIQPKRGRRSVVIRILFWHHLRALNYARMAIQRRAHRLVEFHTAKCRRRMDSVKNDDGSYNYSHTQISLQTPAGDEDSSRTLEEHLPDPSQGNREKQAVVEVSMAQILNRLQDPVVVRFAQITMAENPPADFHRWCLVNRHCAPKQMGQSDLVSAAMDFVGITHRNLDELRSLCIQEGIVGDR